MGNIQDNKQLHDLNILWWKWLCCYYKTRCFHILRQL